MSFSQQFGAGNLQSYTNRPECDCSAWEKNKQTRVVAASQWHVCSHNPELLTVHGIKEHTHPIWRCVTHPNDLNLGKELKVIRGTRFVAVMMELQRIPEDFSQEFLKDKERDKAGKVGKTFSLYFGFERYLLWHQCGTISLHTTSRIVNVTYLQWNV